MIKGRTTGVKYPPQSNPLKRVDTILGSGFEYMRQDRQAQTMYAEGVFILSRSNYYRNLKLQVACRETGRTKSFESDSTNTAINFRGRRLGEEIDGSFISPAHSDYVLKITGAVDHVGTAYYSSLIKYGGSYILRRAGDFGFRGWQAKRKGERRRVKLNGCILDRNLKAVSLIIIRKGANEIPGLTDSVLPKTLGPKRASKIRKLFNLSKIDDVRKYVVKRPVTICNKRFLKGVKIQRLITPERIRRKTQVFEKCLERSVKRKLERTEYERKFKSLKQSKQHTTPQHC